MIRTAGWCVSLSLMIVSGLYGLTPEEADAAIERGLRAKSIVSVRDYYDIKRFSSRLGHAQKFAGARWGYEYTLLIRGCSQLLHFVAFRSKTDSTIDIEEARTSCLENDRIWIAVDEGRRNDVTSDGLKKLLRLRRKPAAPPVATVASTAPTHIRLFLDGRAVHPIREIQLSEYGPGSASVVFPVEPFREATEGRIMVRINEREEVSASLSSELIGRLFGD
jgi:hypothetical protein